MDESNNKQELIDLISKSEKTNIDLRQIYLWPDNPRLLIKIESIWNEQDNDEKLISDNVQDAIFEILSNTTHKLRKSINSTGFVPAPDQLLVRQVFDDERNPLVKDIDGEEKPLFVVLEGNRRITALKEFYSSFEEDPNMDEDELLEIYDFRNIPVLILKQNGYSTENFKKLVRKILGIRHVHSIQEWEPWEKAETIRKSLKGDPSDIEERRRLADSWSETTVFVLKNLRNAFAMNQLREIYPKFSNREPDKFRGLFTNFDRILSSVDTRLYYSWDSDNFEFTNDYKMRLLFQMLIGPYDNVIGSDWDKRILRDEKKQTSKLVEYLRDKNYQENQTNDPLIEFNEQVEEYFNGKSDVPMIPDSSSTNNSEHLESLKESLESLKRFQPYLIDNDEDSTDKSNANSILDKIIRLGGKYKEDLEFF